jgi:hypothetical protein
MSADCWVLRFISCRGKIEYHGQRSPLIVSLARTSTNRFLTSTQTNCVLSLQRRRRLPGLLSTARAGYHYIVADIRWRFHNVLCSSVNVNCYWSVSSKAGVWLGRIAGCSLHTIVCRLHYTLVWHTPFDDTLKWPRLVLGWVTAMEGWEQWTCVRSSVLTLNCDRPTPIAPLRRRR